MLLEWLQWEAWNFPEALLLTRVNHKDWLPVSCNYRVTLINVLVLDLCHGQWLGMVEAAGGA